MGLDTSHDCWHGSYSSFMRWREVLHRLIRPKGDHTSLCEAWDAGRYVDWNEAPINVLMGHSDCDGDIPVEHVGPLADALERLLAKMPAGDDPSRPATERFIAGLRRAEAAGEAVEFR